MNAEKRTTTQKSIIFFWRNAQISNLWLNLSKNLLLPKKQEISKSSEGLLDGDEKPTYVGRGLLGT